MRPTTIFWHPFIYRDSTGHGHLKKSYDAKGVEIAYNKYAHTNEKKLIWPNKELFDLIGRNEAHCHARMYVRTHVSKIMSRVYAQCPLSRL